MIEKPWYNEHFLVNKQFWQLHGHSTALPFRMDNLSLACELAKSCDFKISVYGRTLLSCIRFSELLPDHDDDLLICSHNLGDKLSLFLEKLEENNFYIIRESQSMISLCRHGRYFDLHFTDQAFQTYDVTVQGYSLSVSVDAEKILNEKYPGDAIQYFSSPNLFEKLNTKALEIIKLITHGKVKTQHFYKGFVISCSIIKTIPNKIYRSITTSKSATLLTEAEFLKLKIDSDDALNWTWRGKHMSDLFMRGENLGQCLERLKSENILKNFIVCETDTSTPFDEPMHLSYRFWNEGNNFFFYPLKYGFRHCMLPYSATNLYIHAQKKPCVYTEDYFQALPKMFEDEIARLLKCHPIEVTDGCVTSCRHRATAMLGRLLIGEKYIPFYVKS